MTLRVATTQAELDGCIALRIEVFVNEQDVPMDEELDGRDDGALHVLAGPDAAPDCVARVQLLGDVAKIERVCVAKQARGTGLGAEMIRFIHAMMAERHQVASFKLEAQTYALQFYEKLGYIAQGEEFLDAGIPHYLMTRPA